ncbi:hypothetical protein [Lentimicrobium sp. S6]|uniref:hypothetical protein n=1 Tax=Lentimicrobium sp. S6 TaxID=2735872 RepID=UPI001551B91B|nr:hypothetical protein [Lentimicrobium sp. S6]NPD48172.1 hypothetical protein [Lentimicrobium sp. S6]
MNFEDFRKDIESKLDSIFKFELLEFHFEPYSFGSGILAYRIKGLNHKFVYDGRENTLIWLISKSHQKYFGTKWTEFKNQNGLEISIDELENGIKTVHNN